ncbi:MAG: ADP-ribosylglycohydrolase family protein [Prosthecobacter sp.]|nr:ADP-ribosylglycohydrolase family protein [Prosthecobacter sp.]
MRSPSDIVLTSLIGDALALGPHWIYDQGEIAAKLGKADRFHAPMTSYHPGKAAGDFTHYGDQTMVLLRSIQKTGKFDLAQFAADWRAFWENPTTISYRDGATKATLANLQAGMPVEKAASGSHDLAGAGRIAPLFLLRWEDDAALVAAARAVTGFTHGDPAVVDAAEFFARVVMAVQRGTEIPKALNEAASSHAKWVSAGRESSASTMSDAEALERHGLSCDIGKGFPAVCHLLFRHPEDAAAGLIANASAGGDCAARGTILGMVYGARFGVSELPEEWVNGLKAREEIMGLLM